MKLLTNFDVNLISFLEVMNVWNAEFVPLPGDEVRICHELQFMKIFRMIREFFLKWSAGCPIKN